MFYWPRKDALWQQSPAPTVAGRATAECLIRERDFSKEAKRGRRVILQVLFLAPPGLCSFQTPC